MLAVGIDIGGTSIKGAAVDSNGRVYEKFSLPVIKGEPGETTVRKLAEIVKDYIASQKLENKIVGIGIGCPGTLDVEKGIVNYSNNLGWDNLPIAKIINETLPYPVRLTNDANAAALGEAKFGAGKTYETIILLTFLRSLTQSEKKTQKLFREQENLLNENKKYKVENDTKLKIRNEILKIIKCLKIKIICFLIIEILLMLFFLYYVTAFCHVYYNTQLSWFLDSLSSYVLSLIISLLLSLICTIIYEISIKYKLRKLFRFITFIYSFG